MNPLDLIPGWARLLLVAAIVAAAAWAFHLWKESIREDGREEVRAEHAEAARAAARRMRELQRAAEKRYVVQAEVQEHFFVETVREVHHAAAPLAACPVPADAVRLLNAAAACAGGDSAAACGGDRSVPGAPAAR